VAYRLVAVWFGSVDDAALALVVSDVNGLKIPSFWFADIVLRRRSPVAFFCNHATPTVTCRCVTYRYCPANTDYRLLPACTPAGYG